MTLIEQLNRLAEIAPGVCKVIHYSDGDIFKIGGYKFFTDYQNSFNAKIGSSTYARARPALAWLRDALEQVIEARGWEWEIGHRIHGSENHYAGNVWMVFPNIRQSNFYDTSAGALLAALIAALEEGEG